MMEDQPFFFYLFCIMAELIGVFVAICSCRFFIRWLVSAFSKTKKNAEPERMTGQWRNDDQGGERSARTFNDQLEMMHNRPIRVSGNYIERNAQVRGSTPRRQYLLRYGPSMPTIYETEEEHESSSGDHTRQAVPLGLVVVDVDHSVHVGSDEAEMNVE